MKAKSWLMMCAAFAMTVSFVPWNAVAELKDGQKTDDEAIRSVVDNYYRGVSSANRGLLESAWDVKNGHMKFVNSRGPVDIVAVVPIRKAVDWWTRDAARKSSSKILDLDIVDGKMAMVKLEFVYDRLHYIEYLTLLKVAGKWKIVSKAYVSKKLDG